jgi:hypothetical protein
MKAPIFLQYFDFEIKHDFERIDFKIIPETYLEELELSARIKNAIRKYFNSNFEQYYSLKVFDLGEISVSKFSKVSSIENLLIIKRICSEAGVLLKP